MRLHSRGSARSGRTIGHPSARGAFLKKASELDPKNVQNRVRLARCYVAMGRVKPMRQKEAFKGLNKPRTTATPLIVLAEAARSKEEIQAAKEQRQKFPKKKDVSFYLASANLVLEWGRSRLRRATRCGKRSLPIFENRAARPYGPWEICICSKKDPKRGGDEFKKGGRPCPITLDGALEIRSIDVGDGQHRRGKKNRHRDDETGGGLSCRVGPYWPRLP